MGWVESIHKATKYIRGEPPGGLEDSGHLPSGRTTPLFTFRKDLPCCAV